MPTTWVQITMIFFATVFIGDATGDLFYDIPNSDDSSYLTDTEVRKSGDCNYESVRSTSLYIVLKKLVGNFHVDIVNLASIWLSAYHYCRTGLRSPSGRFDESGRTLAGFICVFRGIL